MLHHVEVVSDLLSCVFAQGYCSIDRELIDRIKTSYRSPSNIAIGNSMWGWINDRKTDVHDALLSDDDALERILLRPGHTDLCWGFDDLVKDGVDRTRNNPEKYGPALASHLTDQLRKLSEATGARRASNPEQPNAEGVQPTLAGADEILDVMALADLPIDFPNPFPDEYGLPTARGIAAFRAIQSVYQAWRLRELSRSYGTRVLEVGAGLGRTAYYAKKLGLRDYTIVDLPLTAVAQAAFLGQVLGPSHVTLAHETPRPEAVRLINPSQLRSAGAFDIVLNADSLTEMDEAVAADYAKFVSMNAHAFLSINHEVNRFCVRDLLSPDTRAYRQPYWMRPGYVEELYVSAKVSVTHPVATTPKFKPPRWLTALRSQLARPRSGKV